MAVVAAMEFRCSWVRRENTVAFFSTQPVYCGIVLRSFFLGHFVPVFFFSFSSMRQRDYTGGGELGGGAIPSDLFSGGREKRKHPKFPVFIFFSM